MTQIEYILGDGFEQFGMLQDGVDVKTVGIVQQHGGLAGTDVEVITVIVDGQRRNVGSKGVQSGQQQQHGKQQR